MMIKLENEKYYIIKNFGSFFNTLTFKKELPVRRMKWTWHAWRKQRSIEWKVIE